MQKTQEPLSQTQEYRGNLREDAPASDGSPLPQKGPREPGQSRNDQPVKVSDVFGDEEAGSVEESASISQSRQLIKLAERCDKFHSPSGEDAYTRFRVGDHQEVSKVHGARFATWLKHQHYAEYKQAPNGQAFSDAIKNIEAQALFEGRACEARVRVAEHNGFFYLDLANDDWQAVRISPNGWEVVDNPPVLFLRPNGVRALPTPVDGGDVADLRRFIPVDDEQWPLLAGWLVATLRPVGPYPILAVHGEQGSGKSTTCRVARRCVDPNKADLRSSTMSEHDLVIQASNAHVLAFDNLSTIPDRLSDALCRLATGGGFSTRRLYENDEETIFEAQRPMILNGIEEVATRSDLVDRCVLLNLPRITPKKRRLDEEFWADFERSLPRILGSLLTAVSTAMKRIGDVTLEEFPRMADFAQWATAAEPALGLPDGAFMAAYTANRNGAHELALESSPVGKAVLNFVKSQGGWCGTATDLLEALTREVGENTSKQKTWPKSAQSLGGILKRVAPNLRALGAGIDWSSSGRGNAKSRQIELTWLDVRDAVPADPNVPIFEQ